MNERTLKEKCASTVGPSHCMPRINHPHQPAPTSDYTNNSWKVNGNGCAPVFTVARADVFAKYLLFHAVSTIGASSEAKQKK